MVASAFFRRLPGLRKKVSIPFIAGQWSLRRQRRHAPTPSAASQSPSLRGSGRFTLRRSSTPAGCASLNPLHCGAVVASAAPRGSARTLQRCLNPLHCGAVVASSHSSARATRALLVSIPFIAGQWSLRRPCCGRRRRRRLVSIPFIAGQWSLRVLGRPRCSSGGSSQSPSLRGSGRFLMDRSWQGMRCARLNPLHCGAVVASAEARAEAEARARLNPLHCGAVVASGGGG